MIAATHFDPVVGVDIHIIQPPGPVPPVPVPHPFIGMVIDPMEYAPIIGGTVKVNGMMRGTAGTGGKCLPPHIPIGGVFVKPPSNECEIFMGSQTVAFDGDPASRLGLPALSCHCIGMPSPPRMKPHTKPKSLELPTSLVLAVPKGPPVLIGGPPTISLMAMAMKFGMAVLGRALKKLRQMQKASKRWAGISDRMRKAANAMLDRVPGGQRIKNAVSNGICTLTGHPVDVATGKVTTEAIDIELPGPLPFRFTRVWYSNSDYGGPLGHGWHNSYDLGLYEFPEGVVVRLPDGRFATFEPPKSPVPGEAEFNRTEKLFLRRTNDAYEVETLDGLIYSFGWRGKEGEERPLREVRDPNGNRIELVREKGKLAAFIDSGGRRLPVTTDMSGRITEIRGPDPENPGETFPLVTFCYSRDGDLVEVGDALGHPFRYAYGNHLLLKETDRAGLSFYFMYDSDGPTAKCLRTWGDGDFYLRDLTYDTASRRTEVVDSLGHKTVYQWNDAGLVTTETDPLGGVTKTEWGLFNEKLSTTDAIGAKTSFEYDEMGRLLAVVDPIGAAVRYGYDAAGNQTTFTDPAGHVWKREYDNRRNVIAVTDPLGNRQTFELDRLGLPARTTDPLGHSSHIEWSSSGIPVRLTDRLGATRKFEHDALGRVVRATDPAGSVAHVQFDRRGNPVTIIDAVGASCQTRYDAAGNTVEEIDAAGRAWSRTYTYLGRVASVRTPAGRLSRYRYDTEGELIAIEDSADRVWSFVRDGRGRVVEERTFDGRVLRFEYDPAGRIIASVNSRGERIEMKRDLAGRLIARKLPGGRTETFAYTPSGQLASATNGSAQVKWQYDPCGRVVAETVNGRVVRNGFDALGRRIARTSPFGRTMNFEYDAEARLVGVMANGSTVFKSEFDRLGQERRRSTSDGATLEREYLPTGETAAVRLLGRDPYERRYEYDIVGNQQRQTDSAFGNLEYRHDADGLLIGADVDGRGAIEYPRDRSGLILPTAHPDTKLDEDGNVVERGGADGLWRLSYDPLGRLERAKRDGGEEIAFVYDALGRRIRKTAGPRVVEYVWDDDWLLGEVDAGTETGEYVFRPGTFEPLARVAAEGTTIIDCDPVGLPRAAVRSDGQVAWQATYEPFGQLLSERGRQGLIPLRYPGQFEDGETGLYYNRYRYYDPGLRAYVSPDPAGLNGGDGLWSYVPSPLTWIDPYGLISCKAQYAANMRALGLDGVQLRGSSFNSGRKQLEAAGFVLTETTETGRKVFTHPRTGAVVHFDSGKALVGNQKPHWHVRDRGGQKYDHAGRPVVAGDGEAGHIPAG